MYLCMYVCMYACMYVCMYVYMYVCMYVCMYQVFIQALLSTAIFPQRFNVFTACLNQWLRRVASWQTLQAKFLKFRSADCWKMYISQIFLEENSDSLQYSGFYPNFVPKNQFTMFQKSSQWDFCEILCNGRTFEGINIFKKKLLSPKKGTF